MPTDLSLLELFTPSKVEPDITTIPAFRMDSLLNLGF